MLEIDRRERDITPREFPECVKPLPYIGSMVRAPGTET
jgi:hypothetical protein